MVGGLRSEPWAPSAQNAGRLQIGIGGRLTSEPALQTPEGKKLYALRKQTPEPVFGIIKSVLGFRQFLLRGLDNVRGEWNLVTMAWNVKRMFALAGAN